MSVPTYVQDALVLTFFIWLYWQWIVYELKQRVNTEITDLGATVEQLSASVAHLPRYHKAFVLTAKCRKLITSAKTHRDSGRLSDVFEAIKLLNFIKWDSAMALTHLNKTT